MTQLHILHTSIPLTHILRTYDSLVSVSRVYEKSIHIAKETYNIAKETYDEKSIHIVIVITNNRVCYDVGRTCNCLMIAFIT